MSRAEGHKKVAIPRRRTENLARVRAYVLIASVWPWRLAHGAPLSFLASFSRTREYASYIVNLSGICMHGALPLFRCWVSWDRDRIQGNRLGVWMFSSSREPVLAPAYSLPHFRCTLICTFSYNLTFSETPPRPPPPRRRGRVG